MRRIASLFIILIFFSTTLRSQRLMDSVTSTLLKMKMPVGTVRLRAADSIRMTTGLLDSFTVVRDFSLNKYTAESFYIPNYDSLKARLDRNKFTISRMGSTDFYAIKKDSFNYIARISTDNQQTMVSMKPMTVSSSSLPYTQVNKIVASDRINNVEFGRAVSISNNYAVVGTQLEDKDAEGKNPKPDAGAAYIYERGSDNKWKEVQKIVATDRAPGANFGWSVGISGNTIVVGAIYERFDATGRNESTSEGAAYVFERGSDGVWKQTQKLLSSDRSGYNYFGTSVGIDGNIIVVGASGHSRDSTERQEGYVGDAGAVFVFEKRGNNWRRTYKLLASDRQHGGSMGNSVAISGNFVIAGAWAHDYGIKGETRMEACGAAYIWERMEDGKWTKAQKLVASDGTPYDEFGFSVAIDGDNAVVGARNVTLKREDENNNGYSGEAYIFSRNENGEWKEVEAIIPKDRKSGDLVGVSVGVSGNYVIIGSPRGDGKKPYIGAVNIYWKNPQGKWVHTQKINASDEGTYANFGHAIAIHKGFIISGAYIEWRDVEGKNEFSNAGAAYIFMRGDNQSKGKANPVTPKQAPKPPTKKTQ
jgi:FG-GAP repeat